MFSNLNSDKPLNISQLNGKFLTSELEQLNYYLDEDKKFDEVRKLLLARLLNLQTKINHEWSKIDLIKKSELLFEMQEILYDMQLVEHAAKTPLLNITKILFSANPARCICRETSPAKSKPPKRRRSELGGLGNVGCSFGLNEEVRTIVGITKRVNREEEQRNSYDDWEQTSAQNSRKSSIRTTIKQPCQRKGLIVSRTPSGKFQSDRTTLSPSNIILQDLSISKNSSNRNEDSTETNNEDFQNNNNDDCLDELDGTIQISSDQDCPSPPTFYKNIDEKLQSSLLHCNRSPPWNGRQTSVECEIEFSPLGTRASKRRICVKGGDNDCGEGRSPRKRNREMNDIALDGEVRRRPAVSNDEPTYCLCEQVSFGDMICCDYELCSVEWFHFSCVNLKSKPKQGKRWFCPLCRLNDKPGSLKPELQQKLDQLHKLQGH